MKVPKKSTKKDLWLKIGTGNWQLTYSWLRWFRYWSWDDCGSGSRGMQLLYILLRIIPLLSREPRSTSSSAFYSIAKVAKPSVAYLILGNKLFNSYLKRKCRFGCKVRNNIWMEISLRIRVTSVCIPYQAFVFRSLCRLELQCNICTSIIAWLVEISQALYATLPAVI